MRFDMRGVDHLRVSGPPAPSKRPKQVFPNAAPRPAYKAIIDRRRGAIFGRAITPAAAALEYMHDAADYAAIIYALDASYIPRQVKFDPLPLLIAQPKQVFAHDPNPLPKTNQDRIVRPEELMSFDPRYRVRALYSLASQEYPRLQRMARQKDRSHQRPPLPTCER